MPMSDFLNDGSSQWVIHNKRDSKVLHFTYISLLNTFPVLHLLVSSDLHQVIPSFLLFLRNSSNRNDMNLLILNKSSFKYRSYY